MHPSVHRGSDGRSQHALRRRTQVIPDFKAKIHVLPPHPFHAATEGKQRLGVGALRQQNELAQRLERRFGAFALENPRADSKAMKGRMSEPVGSVWTITS